MSNVQTVDDGLSSNLNQTIGGETNASDYQFQALLFGIRLYREDLVTHFEKTDKGFKTSLASLSRVQQICMLVLRDHFVMNEIIHKDVDLEKHVAIKI